MHGIYFILIIGVYLSLRGVVYYYNNSIIYISEIGELESNTNNALQCITDRMPCCRSPQNGDWYFPNGTIIKSNLDPFTTFYRNSGDDGTVNLNHVRLNDNTTSPVGLFCCRVSDSTNITQQICAYISELC
jgi:hypothetical protein